MLFITKIINMLRTTLYDISIYMNNGSHSCKSPDLLNVYARISSGLDKLERDFAEFFEIYKEFKNHE